MAEWDGDFFSRAAASFARRRPAAAGAERCRFLNRAEESVAPGNVAPSHIKICEHGAARQVLERSPAFGTVMFETNKPYRCQRQGAAPKELQQRAELALFSVDVAIRRPDGNLNAT